ncbi:MAG: hypothetical protein AAF525_16660, partial [Pseudomonadota bacterium]
VAPGGLMCHIIDLRDHGTLSNHKDWLRFLQYSPRTWNLMRSNRTTWSNRLLASDCEQIFQDNGFEILVKQTEPREFHESFSRDRLHPDFRQYTDDDLRVAWLSVVLRAGG